MGGLVMLEQKGTSCGRIYGSVGTSLQARRASGAAAALIHAVSLPGLSTPRGTGMSPVMGTGTGCPRRPGLG